MKCPAFFKQYIYSGKSLDDCYDQFYNNIIFHAGKNYEQSEVEKLTLVKTTKSLEKALCDESITAIRISPETILQREVPVPKNLKKYKPILAIGSPDLIVKRKNSFIPLDYKTSLSLSFFNCIIIVISSISIIQIFLMRESSNQENMALL